MNELKNWSQGLQRHAKAIWANVLRKQRGARRDILIEQIARSQDKGMRAEWVQQLLGRVGEKVKVEGAVWCENGKKVELGKAVYLGSECRFWDSGAVKVGSWAVIGPRAIIRAEKRRPVEIGERVWIGEGVEILPGTQVGDDAVICAGTVVNGEVPARGVVMGNPWRVVRQVR